MKDFVDYELERPLPFPITGCIGTSLVNLRGLKSYLCRGRAFDQFRDFYKDAGVNIRASKQSAFNYYFWKAMEGQPAVLKCRVLKNVSRKCTCPGHKAQSACFGILWCSKEQMKAKKAEANGSEDEDGEGSEDEEGSDGEEQQEDGQEQ